MPKRVTSNCRSSGTPDLVGGPFVEFTGTSAGDVASAEEPVFANESYNAPANLLLLRPTGTTRTGTITAGATFNSVTSRSNDVDEVKFGGLSEAGHDAGVVSVITQCESFGEQSSNGDNGEHGA